MTVRVVGQRQLELVLVCVQVEIPGLQARYLHRAAAFTLTPGLTDVVLFGGCTELPSRAIEEDADYPGTANVTVIRFGEPTLYSVWSHLHQ